MGLNSIIPTGEAHCSYTTKALAGGPVEHFNLKEDSLMSSWLYICRSKAACSVVLSGGSGGGDESFCDGLRLVVRGASTNTNKNEDHKLLATPQPKSCTICQFLFDCRRILKQ